MTLGRGSRFGSVSALVVAIFVSESLKRSVLRAIVWESSSVGEVSALNHDTMIGKSLEITGKPRTYLPDGWHAIRPLSSLPCV
jgi:hypothetical protein